jgi:hypothetical protein
MANAFSKEERLAFDQMLEGFNDSILRVYGDFADDNQRLTYAQNIAKRLNGAVQQPAEVPEVYAVVLSDLIYWMESNYRWDCLPIPVARAMALQRALREVTSVPKHALQDCRDVQQERDALASIVKRLAAADFGAGTWTSEAEAAAKEARAFLNRKVRDEN